MSLEVPCLKMHLLLMLRYIGTSLSAVNIVSYLLSALMALESKNKNINFYVGRFACVGSYRRIEKTTKVGLENPVLILVSNDTIRVKLVNTVKRPCYLQFVSDRVVLR